MHRFALSIVLLVSTGCGDDSTVPDAGLGDAVGDSATPPIRDTGTDGPSGELNACGGEAVLEMVPGEVCGDCMNGLWVCDGTEAVVCGGAQELNACGGCDLLSGGVGDECGACDDGAYLCAEETLSCSDASTANACGGCTDLVAEVVGGACDVGGEVGVYVCQGADVVACVLAADNACGGREALGSDPGTPCGECDLGIWSCTDIDTVSCEGETDGLNECGGCGDLVGDIGESCGECGGSYACVDGGFVICDTPALNACGGCGALGLTLGDPCEGGIVACVGDDAECVLGAANICGGGEPLTGVLGDPCGECGDGALRCAGLDGLVCLGASAVNICGGCGLLVGTPGEGCGAPGFLWTCTPDGPLTCIADPEAIVRIELTPEELVVTPGETGSFVATAHMGDGSTRNVTGDVIWSSDDESIATVDGGEVTGITTGSAEVTATLTTEATSVSGTGSVIVEAITAIDVSPTVATTPLGTEVRFSATATFESGDTRDVTGSAVWTSSDETVATVVAGQAAPRRIGSTSIAASLGGVMGNASLTVGAAEVVSIAVAPTAATLAAGRSQMLTATATLTDGTNSNVTTQCAWTSSSDIVATVAAGFVTARTVGSATIECAFDGEVGQSAITVTLAEIESLAIEPDAPSLFVGATATLTATATYSDGNDIDVTAMATWSSDDAATATVAAGVVSAVAGGTANVRAMFDGEVAAVVVTVRTVMLTGISVTPSAASVAAGLTVAYQAMGTFSDTTTADVSGSVTWSTLDGVVASIDGIGVATGEAPGSTTVRASLDGIDADASITVTPAEIVGLAVTPAALSVESGGMASLVATATYTNGSSLNVTALATWMSTDNGVAAVSAGMVLGVSEGMATVAAMLDGAGASALVTVTPPVLTGLSLETAGPFSIGIDMRVIVPLTATFSDGTMTVVTSMAIWSSNASGVAPVETATGWTLGVSPGTAMVSASFGGMTTTFTVNVLGGAFSNHGPAEAIGVAFPSVFSNHGPAAPINVNFP